MLKVLITSHLNMSLLLLKPEFGQTKQAADQAISALELISPFAVQQGSVFSFRKGKKHLCRKTEQTETFKEAKALQAKGYFRLGCAEMELGEFKAAVKSFECSLKAASATSGHPKPPDSLVVRRLQEAKRKHKAETTTKSQKVSATHEGGGGGVHRGQGRDDDDDEDKNDGEKTSTPTTPSSSHGASSAAVVTPNCPTQEDSATEPHTSTSHH